MYCEHFNLKATPFSLTPDTSFFLNRAGYQDALNVLLVAIKSGEGFVKVVGEVGTGKTLLCRKLMSSLGADFVSAYIHNPFLDSRSLLHAVADELGAEIASHFNQHDVIKSLANRLLAIHGQGRGVVLCLDEVQAMPVETLETLRLLTNLETEKRKLIQVVLFGQPELDGILADTSIRQLRQRITFSYQLLPMNRAALTSYVDHRMRVAGAPSGTIFTTSALDRVYRDTGGIPRLVNILCHKALLSAYGQGSDRVRVPHIKAAVRDTVSFSFSENHARGWRVCWRWAMGLLGVLVTMGLGAGLSLAMGG